MATATKTTKQVTVPQPPISKTVKSITLELTEAEAQTIRVICDSIGGYPSSSLRAHADAIVEALSSTGIWDFECADKSGSLYFSPETGI